MKFEDCTKEELLYLIHSKCFYRPEDLEFDVLMHRISAADRKASEASYKAGSALAEYAELLQPYSGQKMTSVPDAAIHKASEAWKQYQKYTKQSNALYDKSRRLHKEVDRLINREPQS